MNIITKFEFEWRPVILAMMPYSYDMRRIAGVYMRFKVAKLGLTAENSDTAQHTLKVSDRLKIV